MDLRKFNNFVVKDAIEARNFMSVLIGYFRGNEENIAKAIIGLYESFSEAIKKDEKAFSKTMLKFMLQYHLIDEHMKYYEQFKSYWTNADIQNIKKFNAHRQWDKTIYKNSLEFVTAASLYRNSDELIQFLKDSQQEITKLIKKDKKKLIENLEKTQIWKRLLETDYDYLKFFCQQHDIICLDIVSLLSKTENHVLTNALLTSDILWQDIQDNRPIIFEEAELFSLSPKRTQYRNHTILELLIEALIKQKYILVENIFLNYLPQVDKEVSEYVNYGNAILSNKRSKKIGLKDLNKKELFKSFKDTIINGAKYRDNSYTGNMFSLHDEKELAEALNQLPQIQNIILKIKLDKMESNSVIAKPKI